jgi:DNA-binding transcriptional MerR regulator
MGIRTAVTQTARIGEAAQQTGLSIDAIRFYEREGLLKRSPRSEGGFRLFSPGDIQTLQFIRKSQAMGFSLAEIRELLLLRSEQVPACSHVKELLEQKLAGVRQKIQELEKLEQGLKKALRRCTRELKANRASHDGCCPVLEEISRAAGVPEKTNQ